MESDLSVFHRIDAPLEELHPQRLIDFVVRLGYYEGAVRARLRAEVDEDEAVTAPLDIGADRTVPSDANALAVDPVLGELIEIA